MRLILDPKESLINQIRRPHAISKGADSMGFIAVRPLIVNAL